MRELYTTLENAKIGLFESPTGTVQTSILALISPVSLYWCLGKVNESYLWCPEMAEGQQRARQSRSREDT